MRHLLICMLLFFAGCGPKSLGKQQIACPICNAPAKKFAITEMSLGYRCEDYHYTWIDRSSGEVNNSH